MIFLIVEITGCFTHIFYKLIELNRIELHRQFHVLSYFDKNDIKNLLKIMAILVLLKMNKWMVVKTDEKFGVALRILRVQR